MQDPAFPATGAGARSSAGSPVPPIGIALAGGGPEGGVYELGALFALEEATPGVDWNDLHVYVGLSAGAFICSCLANGITTAEMCRAIVSARLGDHPFTPETFFTPAYRTIGDRLGDTPRLLTELLGNWLRRPWDLTLAQSLLRLMRNLPVGIFESDAIRKHLERLFRHPGRTDDFRELGKRLYVVATDLDAGTAVRFGEPGYDHVPISRAVEASSALPGLYPPVEIDGRSYVDGVLLKTLHASVALDAGAKLVICINPIVPVDTGNAVAAGVMRRGKLVDRGLPAVLSQAVRTLIRSRLQAGIDAYGTRYEDADIVLVEPTPDDYEMFFTNIFSFSKRRAVCEHAYESTRRQLLARYNEIAPLFESHGLVLDREILSEPRELWESVDAALAHLETKATPRERETGRFERVGAVREERSERPRKSATPGRTAEPRGDEVVGRLDGALDRLEQLLDERGAA